MTNATVKGSLNVTHIAVNGAINVCKLRMVEGVEEFRPELEQHPLRHAGIFVQCEVPLVESRSMEETSLGVLPI